MAAVRLEKIRDYVIALRPVYTDKGDATEIYLANGEVKVFYSGIKAVRRAFLKNYAVDFFEQQRLLSQEFGKSRLLPFYIDERVFIPLKMRKTVSKNDMVNGYVEVGAVRDFKREGRLSCLICLATGAEIPLTCGEETLIKSFHMGKRLQERLVREREDKGLEYKYKAADSLLTLVAELGAVMGKKQG
ncbi:hypothetical protein [Thermosyntropha sp.]|uniref:hypothetical protein n=1 Tax=Thermosyntropha sp. TaxID=2740820 RepID=UPI0025ECD95A|nr:hypothetical protein [Thermosyntropha sp.]MBO8159064.1 hypothetical protein [Thermosyntropha sp.]